MWPHTMRLASCQNRFKPRLMAQSRKDSSHLARLPLAWSAPSVSQPIVFTTRPNLYQIFLLRSSIWMTIFSLRIGTTKDMPSERLQRSLKVSPVSCLRLVNLKKHKKRWANLSLENLTKRMTLSLWMSTMKSMAHLLMSCSWRASTVNFLTKIMTLRTALKHSIQTNSPSWTLNFSRSTETLTLAQKMVRISSAI